MKSLEKLEMIDCKLTFASLNTLCGVERHHSLKILQLGKNNFVNSADLSFVTKLVSLEILSMPLCKLASASLNRISGTETHNSLKCCSWAETILQIQSIFHLLRDLHR